MKKLVMTGPAPAFRTLTEAIRKYADAAYPPGASECAQSARAGLLDTAQTILEQLDNNPQEIIISRRIKSHIKAAIQYYLQIYPELNLDQEVATKRSELMLELLNGTPLQDQQWS
ncbi:MAG: hypothetical protein PVG20_02185 [Thioalkalispiraceae bacterium]|jgi:hypothetical protein